MSNEYQHTCSNILVNSYTNCYNINSSKCKNGRN